MEQPKEKEKEEKEEKKKQADMMRPDAKTIQDVKKALKGV